MERLLASQNAANLQGYDDRFSSLTQLSDLLARIDGCGTDPAIAAQVEVLITKTKEISNRLVIGEVKDSAGPSDYEKQKAAEDPWE